MMNFNEAIKLALSGLRTNKLRSLLTLLGIIVGIASVIAIMTLGKAFQAETQRSFTSSGINDIIVTLMERPADGEPVIEPDPFAMMMAGPSTPVDERSKFTANSLEEIRSKMGSSIVGIPLQEWVSGATITSDHGEVDPNTSPTVLGVNLDYLKLNDVQVAYGRSLTQDDIDSQRRVAVVSQDLVDSLFPGGVSEAMGSRIEITSIEGIGDVATIVGVSRVPDPGMFGLGFGSMSVYVPYSVTSRYSSTAQTSWDSISVRPADNADLVTVRDQLQVVVDDMYANNTSFMPHLQDFSSGAEAVNSQLALISMVISAIGGISLLVGGIGVMNIMLVAVTERTREIGMRKALGAKRRDIRRQFVIEAMIICLVGGIIGVLVGGALGMAVGTLIGPLVFPPVGAVVVALLFSLGIGLFFGFYPANKAAKLHPIDSLRYE